MTEPLYGVSQGAIGKLDYDHKSQNNRQLQLGKCARGTGRSLMASDWSAVITGPGYWPLIGQQWSQDLDTGLWLVSSDHGTWILASDWSAVITGPGYWPLIGQQWSRDLDTGLWSVERQHQQPRRALVPVPSHFMTVQNAVQVLALALVMQKFKSIVVHKKFYRKQIPKMEKLYNRNNQFQIYRHTSVWSWFSSFYKIDTIDKIHLGNSSM